MKNQDFTTTFTVNQNPHQVFNAINNVGAWWVGTIEGNSKKLGDEFIYRYEDMHYSKHKVVEMIPDKKIVWLTTDSELNFTEDKNEWADTKITFEISTEGNKTQLRFTHNDLTPKLECYKGCSTAWTQILNNLKDFITGKVQTLTAL